MIAVVGALVVGATVFFRVQTIAVSGAQRYTQQQIIEASGAVLGSNLFALNKFDMAAQIRRQLPYVEGVNIRRGLPDTLRITVTETVAAAVVDSADGHWLVSRSGKMLELAGAEKEAMVVTGLSAVQPEAGTMMQVQESDGARQDSMLAVLQSLSGCGLLGEVTSMDLRSSAYVLLQLGERFTVKLPASGDFDYLLGAMNATIEKLEPYESGVLDLTAKDYTVVFSPA